jgi:hypothetical protein
MPMPMHVFLIKGKGGESGAGGLQSSDALMITAIPLGFLVNKGLGPSWSSIPAIPWGARRQRQAPAPGTSGHLETGI